MVRLVNPGRDPRPTGAAGAGAGLRAARRLEQAERERTWELSTLWAEWISIRKLAAAAGCRCKGFLPRTLRPCLS